jgi:hypothetical protein
MTMTANLPATVNKAEVLAGIAHWYDLVHEIMTSEAGRELLQHYAYRALHEGTYPTAQVIEAADAGHPGADWALRRYAAEFFAAGRERELLAQVRAYVVQSLVRHPGEDWEARRYTAEVIDQGRWHEFFPQMRAAVVQFLSRPAASYPQGRKLADIWTRNIAIAVMVEEAAKRWNLSRTRKEATERRSAAYYVSKLKGIKLGEQQINRISWHHNQVAARLSALKINL